MVALSDGGGCGGGFVSNGLLLMRIANSDGLLIDCAP